MRLRIAAFLVAATAAAALAACGEKSEPEPSAPATQITTEQGGGGQQQGGGGSGEEDEPNASKEIESAVTSVLGGGDAEAACNELVTEDYVKKAYGDEKGCRAAVNGQGTVDVAVSGVSIKGATATAKAKPSTGPNKGETIAVELVDEGGVWKVTAARSNAKPGP